MVDEQEDEEEMIPIKRVEPSDVLAPNTCPACDRRPQAMANGPKGVTYTCRGGHTWGPGAAG